MPQVRRSSHPTTRPRGDLLATPRLWGGPHHFQMLLGVVGDWRATPWPWDIEREREGERQWAALAAASGGKVATCCGRRNQVFCVHFIFLLQS
jgi:hypothetical protein